jgi:hypothetical protein
MCESQAMVDPSGKHGRARERGCEVSRFLARLTESHELIVFGGGRYQQPVQFQDEEYNMEEIIVNGSALVKVEILPRMQTYRDSSLGCLSARRILGCTADTGRMRLPCGENMNEAHTVQTKSACL